VYDQFDPIADQTSARKPSVTIGIFDEDFCSAETKSGATPLVKPTPEEASFEKRNRVAVPLLSPKGAGE
jgi:hypothetical protein